MHRTNILLNFFLFFLGFIPVILGGQTTIIYDDDLASSWSNWSWGGNYNFDHSNNVKAGNQAIEAFYTDGYGGLQLRSEEAINADQVASIRFWVRADGQHNMNLLISTTDDGNASVNMEFSVSTSWEQKTISMEAIGNPGVIKRIAFQNFTGNPNINVYYDQIELIIDESTPETTQTFIFVDQFGYLPNAEKVAVLVDPLAGFNGKETYIPPAQLEVRRAENDALVYIGTPSIWNDGAMHAQSGDKGWWFDFSGLTEEGNYYVYDAVNDGRSAIFRIDEQVYDDVLKASLKMFYYNRCGMAKESPYVSDSFTDGTSFSNALQDEQCRYVYDAGNAALEKNLSGGWFDAGDYNKYVTFAHSVVHDLLWAYEENPQVFGDNWNIPESGNNLPDILDELKWELDWLLKMTNEDGSVHIKMGSIDFGENAAAPPSNNFDQRYYGPTCTSASLSNASVFAHASKIFAQFPSYRNYAEILKSQAINTWFYALPHLENNTLETACDDGTIKAGDADRSIEQQKELALTAAIHLFDLTGDNSYNQYVSTNIQDAEQISTPFWGAYKLPLNDALLLYTTLPNKDESIANVILEKAQIEASNNYNGYFGFNDLDLYRAFMPDWSYHWGSNQASAGYGVLNLQMKKYNVVPNFNNTFQEKANEQLHYFHGVNPLGLVYLSNMYDLGGDHCVNEIYHAWFNDGTDWDNALNSLYGPPQGFLVGGPNQNYSVSSLSPPFNQPRQKSYLDFNDGFPNNSWELSEPAIYYQAVYVRLLANFVANNTLTSTKEKSFSNPLSFEIYPNPAQKTSRIQFTGLDKGSLNLRLLNNNGTVLLEQAYTKGQTGDFTTTLNLEPYPAGVYFISVTLEHQTIVKEFLIVR